ncbi:hypothetical protein [Streptomyces sp. AC627_RSS907]|uniref:hypothetical protein n=1 Tax=Streptomyces sp. AC627_RSS907 TaxID=2823684 RepID=UPI001C22807E|nr:hypothetical protein [Streptomyces sp. AC627_RSS907]
MLQFFGCGQNIGVGLLRGLDDTRSGLRITLVGCWLLGRLAGLDTVGVRLGLLTGLAATALLLPHRYPQALSHRAAGVPAAA